MGYEYVEEPVVGAKIKVSVAAVETHLTVSHRPVSREMLNISLLILIFRHCISQLHTHRSR